MRILTLWEPWASFIALGLKGNDTRSWLTRYRGKLAIHAAKRLLDDDALETTWKVQELTGKKFNPVDFKYSPGCIVAIADLTDCRMMVQKDSTLFEESYALIDEQTALERAVGDWRQGRYAWKLENVAVLPTPIPHKGGQGLRIASGDLQQRIQEALPLLVLPTPAGHGKDPSKIQLPLKLEVE